MIENSKNQGDKDELYNMQLKLLNQREKLQHLFYKENYKLDIIEQQELLT